MPKVIAPHPMPGTITVTKATVYAYHAAKGAALDAKITAHITKWAASVPVGTMATVFETLMEPDACDCPFVFGHHLFACKGMSGLGGTPLEIVIDLLFPPDGSPCGIPGVTGVVPYGPSLEGSLTPVKYVQKIA